MDPRMVHGKRGDRADVAPVRPGQPPRGQTLSTGDDGLYPPDLEEALSFVRGHLYGWREWRAWQSEAIAHARIGTAGHEAA